MKKLIQLTGLKEGEFLNKWIENRVLRRNRNVIGVISGSTGSSKSMDCLSAMSNWYEHHFNQEFPIENCCFSPSQLIKRIKSLQSDNKLRKAEGFILEEAGTNLGNLDYQNKIQKMFVFILQSFRSMNLVLLLNLPVLTMLNKSARQLIHFNFITSGIDYEMCTAKVKPLFHQLNQHTGKSYWKYPRIKINGKIIAIERLKFSLPPEDLIKKYEVEKARYVNSLTDEFMKELDQQDEEEVRKMARKQLTPTQLEVFEDLNNGLTVIECAKKRDRGERATYDAINRIKDKGYELKNTKKQQND